MDALTVALVHYLVWPSLATCGMCLLVELFYRGAR